MFFFKKNPHCWFELSQLNIIQYNTDDILSPRIDKEATRSTSILCGFSIFLTLTQANIDYKHWFNISSASLKCDRKKKLDINLLMALHPKSSASLPMLNNMANIIKFCTKPMTMTWSSYPPCPQGRNETNSLMWIYHIFAHVCLHYILPKIKPHKSFEAVASSYVLEGGSVYSQAR